MDVGRTSFLSLLEVHERLSELFLLHQEALLALDIELALKRLREFTIELRAHMQVEEEVLLPVYERAGRIQGGPVEFYTGEHRKMLEFLARFVKKLEELKHGPANLKREVIELFDDEALFKHLMEHHDMREENIFYPTLDKVTDEEERGMLLKTATTDEHR
ncbi:MAG TPA: hemerythrin domain-containing protein [Blastocatellia bacterium]|nr:hemerythrin domain-containing protein [Blastocatellia bacterium]